MSPSPEPTPDSNPFPAGLLIGIRRLRADLATYVKRAGAGENIIVTVDGKPLARLGSLDGEARSGSLDDLAHLGLITPPRRMPRTNVEPAPSSRPEIPIFGDVRVDRLVRQVRG